MVKRIAIIGLFFIVGCVSNTIYSTKFPIEIANVFYETNENQTIFTIEFQKSLPSNFVLKKLYFKNQDAEVIQNSSQKATAVFRKPDFIPLMNSEINRI